MGVPSIMVILIRLGQLTLNVLTLIFVVFGYGTNFERIRALVSVVLFKTLTFDVIPK